MRIDDFVRQEERLAGFAIGFMMRVQEDTFDTQPRKRGKSNWHFMRVHLATSDFPAIR